ncbi:MAG: adenine phosphoribosyltransferase [Clostridia bacterium]|nr:adenine phosphoribosyltransferase [Clostridia bacterium]
MAEFYELNIGGLTRQLPILPVNEKLSIAAFIMLGDNELTEAVAPLLAAKLPEVDYLVTAEAKGIPLVIEVAKCLHMDRYVVARKSLKLYMHEPIVDQVNSITTANTQLLALDGYDADMIRGKRVAIVDDVISTGESLEAIERLLDKAGANVVAKAAVLAEGDAANRTDIIFLEKLPLFFK